jgi:hypothetical protein
MKELNSDLTNAKVGDKVYHLDGRVGEVTDINMRASYPISVRLDGTVFHYMLNGNYTNGDNHPLIFTHPVAIIHADDLENIGGFKERVMWVSSDEEKWEKRVVISQAKECFIAWNKAETLEEVDKYLPLMPWKFAREINPRVEEIKEQIAALQKELETIENSK